MKPTFLVIGAAKAGTTALYSLLRQHPDIFLPDIKELNFFCQETWFRTLCGPGDREALAHSVRDAVSYRQLFVPGRDHLARGEVSPIYLYDPSSAEMISRSLPDCRLVVVLRQPAERAFSNYLMMRRDRREPCRSFSRALAKEATRRAAGWEWGWLYKDFGYYGRQLKRYYKYFSRDQILVLLYEDFRDNPLGSLRTICEFLGVDAGFRFQLGIRPNESQLKRSMIAEKLLWSESKTKHLFRRILPETWLGWGHRQLYLWNRIKPQIPSRHYKRLTELYREDLLLLQDLIGRDLSAWFGDGANSVGLRRSKPA